MGYIKPIPVDKEKLIIGRTYYTCNYSGACKVILIKINLDTNKVLVKGKKDTQPYIRPIKYIFDNPEMAKFAVRNWENETRKNKKKKSPQIGRK